MKGCPKPTIKGHRRDNKAGTTMAIANQISSLLSELDKAEVEVDRPLGNIDTVEEDSDAIIQWCDNASFENQISEDMQY
ncbi:hypothetical protein V6N13_014731 [Hibiscus sabdariffa]|uniref:Uncharacterized protein n=1 Tax=Hibiscus sabdariffa TaxID=183260 RepID=A0ABR2RW80_9ROSI